MTVKLGSGRLTAYGKRMVAHAMYSKGTSFLGAAALLHRQGSYESVVLHLMCQGIEIILKALLLVSNHDKYAPQLTALGHNLEKLANTAVAEFGARPLSPIVAHELSALNRRYSKHLLRYGTPYDIVADPATIPTRHVFIKTLAVVRLANRHVFSNDDAT